MYVILWGKKVTLYHLLGIFDGWWLMASPSHVQISFLHVIFNILASLQYFMCLFIYILLLAITYCNVRQEGPRWDSGLSYTAAGIESGAVLKIRCLLPINVRLSLLKCGSFLLYFFPLSNTCNYFLLESAQIHCSHADVCVRYSNLYSLTPQSTHEISVC